MKRLFILKQNLIKDARSTNLLVLNLEHLIKSLLITDQDPHSRPCIHPTSQMTSHTLPQVTMKTLSTMIMICMMTRFLINITQVLPTTIHQSKNLIHHSKNFLHQLILSMQLLMSVYSAVLLLQLSEDTVANYLYSALAQNAILVVPMIILQPDRKCVSTPSFYSQSVN
jgi:hypothetical protein